MKLIGKISEVRSTPLFWRENIYLINRKSKRLTKIEKQTLDTFFPIEEKFLSFSIYENLILSYGLNIYNLEGEKIYSGEKQYSYEDVNFQSLTLWKIVDNDTETVSHYLFDVVKLSFTKTNITLNGVPFLMHDQLLFTRSATEISCVNYVTGTTLWHFDISQFGTYADKKYINEDPIICQRKINRVYYYHNKIIVTLSRAIIALNPDNGELLWKIDFEKYNPFDLIFDANIAYSGRLIYFATIDIEKGIKLFEQGNYKTNIEGYYLTQLNFENVTLYNNHLWFVHEENSRQFLLKANPENGDIVDGMLLETQYSTGAPIFDENRMYILDQDGYLYVYEEIE